MIRTVLLDLDDTLLDFHRAEAVALKKTLEDAGIEATKAVIERYSAINQAQWELLEQRKITRAEVQVRRFAILFEELGILRSAKETSDAYREYLSQGHFFLPGAEEMLGALYGTYRLYLVSNGNASVQDRRLESAGIARYMEDIFISERIGFDKPSVEYFCRCFARIPEFVPEETIILGDSLTSDILGGIQAGIHTCWLNMKKRPGRSDIVPEYEIESLSEFADLLKGL